MGDRRREQLLSALSRRRLFVGDHRLLFFEVRLTRGVSSIPAQICIGLDSVVKLYLHRGSFETVLADEDREQDSDRWSSYTAHGQEVWQILSQWVWNLRQELSQQWQPTSMRLTEFSPPSN